LGPLKYSDCGPCCWNNTLPVNTRCYNNCLVMNILDLLCLIL
jgi:hypothetical protein